MFGLNNEILGIVIVVVIIFLTVIIVIIVFFTFIGIVIVVIVTGSFDVCAGCESHAILNSINYNNNNNNNNNNKILTNIEESKINILLIDESIRKNNPHFYKCPN